MMFLQHRQLLPPATKRILRAAMLRRTVGGGRIKSRGEWVSPKVLGVLGVATTAISNVWHRARPVTVALSVQVDREDT